MRVECVTAFACHEALCSRQIAGVVRGRHLEAGELEGGGTAETEGCDERGKKRQSEEKGKASLFGVRKITTACLRATLNQAERPGGPSELLHARLSGNTSGSLA